MKQTAVEFLEETFNKKHAQFINWPEDYFNEAKKSGKTPEELVGNYLKLRL